MKKIKLFLLLMLIFGAAPSNAVVLPHNMNVYLFEQQGNTNIRFDGLITLKDGTVYLPVIPSQTVEVDKLQIKYTYPEKKEFKDKPDIILFNNNYALLKVIKEGNKTTLTKYTEIPDEILTGILPQDLLVPNGFYISENFKAILGDLEIPVKELIIKREPVQSQEQAIKMTSDKETVKQTTQKTVKTAKTTGKKLFRSGVPEALQDKMYLVTNYDSQYLKIFIPGEAEPIYGLKLGGVLKSMAITPDNRYLLTAVQGRDSVDVADIQNEQIAKTIDLDAQPSEILVDKPRNRAFVLSTDAKSVYILGLDNMTIREKISLKSIPYKMTISDDGLYLTYADKKTDIIYVLELENDYNNVPVVDMKNVAKIVTKNQRVYAISRTENLLKVTDFDLSLLDESNNNSQLKGARLQAKLAQNTEKLLGNIEVLPDKSERTYAPTMHKASVQDYSFATSTKPTDMVLNGNFLYVLCSGTNEIQVYDTSSLALVKTLKLPFNGFARKITTIDNSDIALITDAVSKKYSILNMSKNEIEKTYSIDIPVNSITVIEKINTLNLLEENL